MAERWADLGGFISDNENAAFPVTEVLLRSGTNPDYDAASVFQSMHKLQAFKHRAHQQLKNAVLIMPTCGGTWTRAEVRKNPIETNNKMGIYTNHCNLLNLSAINIPAENAGENLPFGISLFSKNVNEHLISGLAEMIINGSRPPEYKTAALIGVCGLHMRGFSLENQMMGHGAIFVDTVHTSPRYKLLRLASNPPKPGLIRVGEKGVTIEMEIWEMPLNELGHFLTTIPSPLGLGKIELDDGREVIGFLCESAAAEEADDISSFGGWRNFQSYLNEK